MRRTMFAALVLAATLWGCEHSPPASAAPPSAETSDVVVTAHVVDVHRRNDSHWGFGHELVYRITLQRSDAANEDVDDRHDLPEPLSVDRLSVVADGVGEASCRTAVYPYACELSLRGDAQAPTKLTVAVRFADGVADTVALDVGQPPRALPRVDAFTWEPVEPGGGWQSPHRWSMRFQDIGADAYEVILQYQIGGPGPVSGGGGNPFTEDRWTVRDGAVVDTQRVGTVVEVAREGASVRITGQPAPYDGAPVPSPGALVLYALCGTAHDEAGTARECFIAPFAASEPEFR